MFLISVPIQSIVRSTNGSFLFSSTAVAGILHNEWAYNCFEVAEFSLLLDYFWSNFHVKQITMFNGANDLVVGSDRFISLTS